MLRLLFTPILNLVVTLLALSLVVFIRMRSIPGGHVSDKSMSYAIWDKGHISKTDIRLIIYIV